MLADQSPVRVPVPLRLKFIGCSKGLGILINTARLYNLGLSWLSMMYWEAEVFGLNIEALIIEKIIIKCM